MINWDESRPQGSEALSELGQVWRSFKSNFQSAFSQSFYVTSSTSTGQPRASSGTPGFCRAYYGPRADVSHPDRSGTLMVVSDESRLVAFGSAGSNVIGSYKAIFSWVGMSASSLGVYPVFDSGETSFGGGAGNYKLSFNTTFTVTPAVFVTDSSASGSYTYGVEEVGLSSASVITSLLDALDPTDAAVRWVAIAAEPIL